MGNTKLKLKDHSTKLTYKSIFPRKQKANLETKGATIDPNASNTFLVPKWEIQKNKAKIEGPSTKLT